MKQSTKVRALKFMVLMMDAAIIYGSYLIGMLIKFSEIANHEVFQEMKYLIIGIILAELLIIYIYGLYHDLYKSNEEIIVSVLVSIGITGLLTLIYIFLDDYYIYSRFVIIYALSIQFVCISGWHMLAHRISIRLHGLIKVMIIGEVTEAKEVAAKLLHSYKKRYEIIYIIEGKQIDAQEKCFIDIDAIIICSSMDLHIKDHIRSICAMHNKSLYVIPEIYDITIRHTKWQQFDDVAVLSLTSFGMSLDERFLKRSMDICLSLLGLIIGMPLMLVIWMLVKLDSKGPGIFKQERLTKDNQVFYIRKFRTMVVDAEKESGPILAKAEDLRLTRIGGLLRKTRLDELPQLWNVLIGHMSLVGPRPERPHFVESFKETVPNFDYRLKVKAGLTGLAQVMGKYSTNPSDKLRYDLMYINSYSLLLDIRILIQTIRIVFMGERAKGIDQQLKEQYEQQIESIMEKTTGR